MQKITKLSLLLVLLISKNLSAQKVDIDRSWFKVNRTLLPKSPLGDDIKYFNVNVKSNATFRLYIPDNEVVSKVDIEGFALSTKPDNAIQVNIKLNEFMIKKNEVINTRTEDVKNKEGKVISQKKYYQLKLTYTLNTEYDVINGKNNEVLEPQTIYHRQLNELTYKGEEVTSYAIAAKQYNDNGVAIRSKIINDEINNLIYRINGTLSFKYGYARVKTENFLWEMDSKKHPENEVFNSHIQHILDTFKTYTYTSKTEDFDATFGGDIEYFTKLSKLSTEDKQNEKLVQASLWNLSMIYYFNDNSVESKIYGQKLIDSEIDKKDGENIIQMANELEELFKKNNVYSTHFIREMPEPETIAVPEKEAIAAEVKEEAAPQFLAGLVITNEDKEIEGFFFNEIAKVPWGVQDGIRFIPSSLFNEGKYDKKSIEKYKPKELKGLSVDNKVYIPVEYADLSNITNPLAATTKTLFLEVIMDGKFKLLQFHESPPSVEMVHGTGAEEIDLSNYLSYPLLLLPGETKAKKATTTYVEDAIEANSTMYNAYLKGAYSKDGKAINTKRSIVAKIEAKTSLDENIDLEKIVTDLNK